MMCCRSVLAELWSRYGISVLLEAFSQELNKDAREVETTGQYPEEVEVKDNLARELHKAAKHFRE